MIFYEMACLSLPVEGFEYEYIIILYNKKPRNSTGHRNFVSRISGDHVFWSFTGMFKFCLIAKISFFQNEIEEHAV